MFILLQLSLSFSLPENTPKYIVITRTIISLIIIFGALAYFFVKFIGNSSDHDESKNNVKGKIEKNEKNMQEFEESWPSKLVLFLAVIVILFLIFIWFIGLIAKGFGY